jgi:hypothetical protein
VSFTPLSQLSLSVQRAKLSRRSNFNCLFFAERAPRVQKRDFSHKSHDIQRSHVAIAVRCLLSPGVCGGCLWTISGGGSGLLLLQQLRFSISDLIALFLSRLLARLVVYNNFNVLLRLGVCVGLYGAVS